MIWFARADYSMPIGENTRGRLNSVNNPQLEEIAKTHAKYLASVNQDPARLYPVLENVKQGNITYVRESLPQALHSLECDHRPEFLEDLLKLAQMNILEHYVQVTSYINTLLSGAKKLVKQRNEPSKVNAKGLNVNINNRPHKIKRVA